MVVRILAGHVLDRIAQLPDESFNCVVTSPPYWGLRDYGTEPQVWGGDSGCAHIWGGGLRRTGGAGKQGETSQRANRANVKAQETCRDAGSFCRHCDACMLAITRRRGHCEAPDSRAKDVLGARKRGPVGPFRGFRR
jgi:hypothetical protein